MSLSSPPNIDQANPRSAMIRAKYALLTEGSDTRRSARFRARLSGKNQPENIDFAAIAAIPDWWLTDDNTRILIGKAAVILQHRRAIDQELSGVRLAALAQHIGEELFEALCDADLPDSITGNDAHLPRPEDLIHLAHAMLQAALPPQLTPETNFRAEPNPDAREYCALAAHILMMQRHVI